MINLVWNIYTAHNVLQWKGGLWLTWISFIQLYIKRSITIWTIWTIAELLYKMWVWPDSALYKLDKVNNNFSLQNGGESVFSRSHLARNIDCYVAVPFKHVFVYMSCYPRSSLRFTYTGEIYQTRINSLTIIHNT